MPKTVKKALSQNHYDYLNALLDKRGDEQLSEDKKLADAEMVGLLKDVARLKKELEAAAQDALVIENIKKMKNILDSFGDPEKKARYDAGLKKKEDLDLVARFMGGGEKGKKAEVAHLIALVPPQKIDDEFDDMKKSMVGKAKPGGGTYEEGDFRRQEFPGPPRLIAYDFPDEESEQQFLSGLLNKNMAMFPGGSQNIEDAGRKPQSSMRDKLLAIKSTDSCSSVEAAGNPASMTALSGNAAVGEQVAVESKLEGSQGP